MISVKLSHFAALILIFFYINTWFDIKQFFNTKVFVSHETVKNRCNEIHYNENHISWFTVVNYTSFNSITRNYLSAIKRRNFKVTPNYFVILYVQFIFFHPIHNPFPFCNSWHTSESMFLYDDSFVYMFVFANQISTYMAKIKPYYILHRVPNICGSFSDNLNLKIVVVNFGWVCFILLESTAAL